jgi:holliday junction DNA helicase RuvA
MRDDMISALTGELRRVDDDRVQLAAGAMVFDLLVPAADLAELSANIGEQITFHTILDLEGDPTRGNLAPRLIGFLRPDDKRFFELFITVKGIGPKKALRALSVPVARIARAIEAKDAHDLASLEGIGRRMAEQIVAELSGKVQSFTIGGGGVLSARSRVDEDAILVCVSLGLSRPDAQRLLEKVKQSHPDVTSAEALSREMLRLRG